MVKFPEDFWEALKSGDTSSWLFWVDMGIIIFALFALLCVVRCCIWCFDGNRHQDKDSVMEHVKPAPALVNPHYQGPAMPTNQHVRGGHMVHLPSPNHLTNAGWNQAPAPHPPQYVQNPAYNHLIKPLAPQHPHYQHSQAAHKQSHHQPAHRQALNVQYDVQPAQRVPAPAQPPSEMPPSPHPTQVRWSKEDFESVFSDKASVDMMWGGSQLEEKPDGRPLLNNANSPSSHALPGPTAQQQGRLSANMHPGKAQVSPYKGDSPPARGSPSKSSAHGKHRSHGPGSPFSPATKKSSLAQDRSAAGYKGSPQHRGGFHANVEDLYRAHRQEPHDDPGVMLSTPPTQKPSSSVHSTPASSTPPATVPSKIYNTGTPPSGSTPSGGDAAVQGLPMHGRTSSSGASAGGYDRRTMTPKLQPPLPVSPRVVSLLDNNVATNSNANAAAQPEACMQPPHLPGAGHRQAGCTPDMTAAPQAQGRAADSRGPPRGGAGGAAPTGAPGPGPGAHQHAPGSNVSTLDTAEGKGSGLPRAVNPSAYAAMCDHTLHSRKSLGQSQSQGFHLEAELMLVGGGAGDSDASLVSGRDLTQLGMDTQTVAAVECPDDATLSEFLGLTRQRLVQAQFVDKTADRSDRALAVWDLGVRLYKLRRRDDAQFAIMRRMHRLPTSPDSRFWKQAIDIDFEEDSFHPALGHCMTVSGAEEVMLVEIANQSGMWLELRLPPQPPPGVMHERWVKLVMQEGSVACLPKGCTYMLGMPENGMVGLLRARMAAAA